MLSLPAATPDQLVRGGAGADFEAAAPTVRRVAERLTQASEARLTTPAGTDCTLDLRGRAGNAHDRILDRPGKFSAFPNIEANIAPVDGTAAGMLVFDGSIPNLRLERPLLDPVICTVEAGKIVRVDGGHEADLIRKVWADLGDEAVYNVAQVAIGLNTEIRILTGVWAQDHGAFGTVHIGTGTSANLGGTTKAAAHFDEMMYRPTLVLDGEAILLGGELVLQKADALAAIPPGRPSLMPPAGPATETLQPSEMAAPERPRRPAAVWTAALASFAAAALVPLPEGLGCAGAYSPAGLSAAVMFWASGVQDPALSGLLVVAALSALGVMPFEAAVAGFGAEFVWLMAATFIIAQATGDCGLGRRTALGILRAAGGSAPAVLLALLLVVLVLSFMVPTAAGRISMVLPVCLGIIGAADIRPPSNFARAMLIGTSQASIMASIGLATAVGTTVYAVGTFWTLVGVRWAYLQWMTAFFPLVVVFTLVLWRVLLWVFPPERRDLVGGAAYVRGELARMGSLAPRERKMLAVFAGVYALWIAGPRWGVTTAQAGVMGALALLLPGMRLLT